mgnify:CR=1 FL=1
MFFYNLFLYILSPFILIRLITYMIRNSAGSTYLFSKLFGTKNIKKKSIWIHAASVGEMKIAIEVSRELFKIGHTNILITSNTPTSKTLLEDSKLENVTHCYLPMDFYFITKNIIELANIHSKGRVISFFEGGYDLQAISESIKEHIKALKS